MPIVDVEIVVDEGRALPTGLAAAISDRAGEVLGMPPGRVWVRLRTLLREHYAENGGGPPEGVLPVFVTLLLAQWPSAAELERQVVALTGAMAVACDRPADNVHVLVLPEGAGRVAFGGAMVRASATSS